MDQPSVQQLFFQHIKNNLPPHLSLVDEIAELLNISNDSAYRRIRAEKPISFEEIQKLSSHYKISLDQFLHLQSDSLIFTGKLISVQESFFEEYLKNLLQNLAYLNGFEQRHLYYLAKDIPWIDHFQIPELSSFKIFLWLKSILHYESLKGQKFSLKKEHYPQYVELGKKISQQYNKIPTTEIWGLEGINVTIQQIEYYRECGLFESEEDVMVIYDRLEILVNLIEKRAELGKKVTLGEPLTTSTPDFNMFYNELAIGDLE
jgi:plasmid maintenance system antidote protein VapI